ncbi:MAG: sensor domain-containing diguanylate cyclase [Microthrixaceae bacterium]|nr:sensor domain-containing diguanylate cyclase [Microthrixaceae bacterium]
MVGNGNTIWDLDGELASGLADGVCVIAPDGLVVWANAAMASLMETTRSELLGSNGFELLHPDDLARAIDGLDYAQQFPGRTAVAPFRIVSRLGNIRDVEIKTGVITRDGHDYVTVVARESSARRAVNRALRSVAEGLPLDRTVALIAEAVQGRWPHTGMAVVLPDGDEGPQVHVHGLDGLLVAHARGELADADLAAPWDLARQADPIVVVDGAALPENLRNAARAQGFAGFGVAPIRDDRDGDGCLLVWFDHTIIARLEFFHAAPELTELLTVAVDRHHLHHEMWRAARYDSLTGLLNRFGFSERFNEMVNETRSSEGLTTAVFFVDLNDLKGINDRHGHAAGDAALRELARRLAAVAGEDVTARLGGDEFVLVHTVPTSIADPSAMRRAEQLLKAIVGDESDALAASVGLAIDDGVGAPQALLERADVAMYRAKNQGPSNWSL